MYPRQRHAASVTEGLVEQRLPVQTRVGYNPQQTVGSFFARAYSTSIQPHKVQYTPVFGRVKSPRNRQFYVRHALRKER